MRTSLLILLIGLLFCVEPLYAQENDKEAEEAKEAERLNYYKRTFSVGFGINNLPQFNSFFKSPAKPSNYFSLNVTKRFSLTEKEFLRLGLNMDIHPHAPYKFYFSGYYLGYLQRYFLKKPYIYLFGGGDLLVQQQVEYLDVNKKTQNRFGVAPLAGLEFRVRPWLSFATDFSYALSLRQTLIERETSAKTERLSNVFDFSVNTNRMLSFNAFFHF